MALLPPEKSVPWLSALVAAWLGWYLGSFLGIFVAFLLMIAGGALGLHFGKRWVRDNL